MEVKFEIWHGGKSGVVDIEPRKIGQVDAGSFNEACHQLAKTDPKLRFVKDWNHWVYGQMCLSIYCYEPDPWGRPKGLNPSTAS